MHDETEEFRRQRVAEINAQPGSRESLEAEYAQPWTTDQLPRHFEVSGFLGHENSQTVNRKCERHESVPN